MAEKVKKVEKPEEAEEKPKYSKENTWGFHMGMPIEVMTPQNGIHFYGQIDRIDDEIFYITDISRDEVPAALYRSTIKLRGFHSTDTVTVKASVCGTGKDHWKVNQIENLYSKELRESFRQSVNASAEIGYSNELLHRNAKRQDCTILDASAGGLRVRSQAEYKFGDWVKIRNAAIVEDEGPFTLVGSIRWIQKDKDEFMYGIQFAGEMEALEQDRLCRAIFILQRKERKKLSR